MQFSRALVNLILLLALSSVATAAQKYDCSVPDDFEQLIWDLADNDELAIAIKEKPERIEAWAALRESGEHGSIELLDVHLDPDVLDAFIKIPTIVHGDFINWFDNLTYEQATQLYKNEKIEKLLNARFRHPKHEHEWCMVCRVLEFKKWGVSVQQMRDFRTPTEQLTWIVPLDETGANFPGQPGGHLGNTNGSTTFHKRLQELIDKSSNIDEFNAGLIVLAETWKIQPGLPPLIKVE